MTDKMKMYEDLRNYYLDMRESLIDKMKKEDDERSNLKFKIAALAIYELTHSMPEWFKDYFLASMAGIFYNHTESADHLAQIESQFHRLLLRSENQPLVAVVAGAAVAATGAL